MPPTHPPATAGQTAGPYWHLIDFPEWADTTRHLATLPANAERIVLGGTVTDGAGDPVADAMIEIWHAGPDGAYPAEGAPTDGFQGFGRCATAKDGGFRFVTLKPGAVPIGAHPRTNAKQAPHVVLSVFARGLLTHLVTRLYFAGEALNDTDPVLRSVPVERRHHLLARQSAPDAWTLNLRLQGEGESVWMDV